MFVKSKSGSIKQLLLLITPIVASSTIAALPTQAATFSSSKTTLSLNNFNQDATGVLQFTDVNSIALAEDGNVKNTYNGQAVIAAIGPEVFANTDIDNVTVGSGNIYFGAGDLKVQQLGNFLVDATESLQFSYEALLDLKTSVDDASKEIVSSAGDISLLLVNDLTSEILDSFSLFGQLNTDLGQPQLKDSLGNKFSSNFSIASKSQDSQFNLNQEFAKFSLSGSYQRSFSEDTSVTLVAVTQNFSCAQSAEFQGRCVTVPESFNPLAALLYLSGMVFLFRAMKHIVKFAD